MIYFFFLNYCRRIGYVSSECTRCTPQKTETPQCHPNQHQVALQAQVSPTRDEASSSQAVLMIPEHIQDMINAYVTSAFTFMGIDGRYNSISFATLITPSSCYIDSGASKQMTSAEQSLIPELSKSLLLVIILSPFPVLVW